MSEYKIKYWLLDNFHEFLDPMTFHMKRESIGLILSTWSKGKYIKDIL